MPSFFFHIALDIHQISSTACDSRFEADKISLAPFRTTVKHIPHDSRSEYYLRRYSKEKFTSGSTSLAKECHVDGKSANKQDGKGKAGSASISLGDDWRYGKISVRIIDIAHTELEERFDRGKETAKQTMEQLSSGSGTLATKKDHEAPDVGDQDLGWGIVRLYREIEETPGLYDDVVSGKGPKGGKNLRDRKDLLCRDQDCTTLCILAVPSYLTPSDFLGFVGEETRNEVSHFRMIRTERTNRYMVLMKFRNGKRAREWRKEWNGKAFNDIEPENCHVVFVKSIELRTRQQDSQQPSFPDMSNDPFTPSLPKLEASASVSSALQTGASPSAPRNPKPIAPPTPALIELPTCPVCLERMDESTGLLTILCQHVFHCSCLQKWRGSGCPVCRYTQSDAGRRPHGNAEETGLNECSVCRSEVNLWVCLICGNVGCGRYDAAHAFSHYEQSSHCFAMDLTTQRVWDYASDGYVHRIVQNKTDGKLVQLPSTPTADTFSSIVQNDGFDDYVPREKLDNIGQEYTHLLTSQLDSQRMYFEEILERAADKTSQATRAAEKASEATSLATQQLVSLQEAHDVLTREKIPGLERELERTVRKLEKFEAMARKLEKEWREEKAMSGSLLERVNVLKNETEGLRKEKAELEEQNRDLSFFISGGEKLRTVQGDAGITDEELRDGTLSVADVPVKGKGKQKGRGKK